MSDFDAILFDFDGVLADTEPVHYACWKEALEPLGVELDWGFFRDRCIGVNDRDVLRMVADQSDPPLDSERLWAQYPVKKEIFRRRMLVEPPFAPELAGFLGRLRESHRLAVVTSSIRLEIEPLLEAGGLRGCFETLVCGHETPNKPAPDPYLLAARTLNAVNPLVVEDSEIGIASGRSAGFEVLKVPSSAEMPELLLRRLSGGLSAA